MTMALKNTLGNTNPCQLAGHPLVRPKVAQGRQVQGGCGSKSQVSALLGETPGNCTYRATGSGQRGGCWLLLAATLPCRDQGTWWLHKVGRKPVVPLQPDIPQPVTFPAGSCWASAGLTRGDSMSCGHDFAPENQGEIGL